MRLLPSLTAVAAAAVGSRTSLLYLLRRTTAADRLASTTLATLAAARRIAPHSLSQTRCFSLMADAPPSAPAATVVGSTSADAAASASVTSAQAAVATPAAASGDGWFTPVFPSVLVQPLREMGFAEVRCVRALHATGGASVDNALQWLFEHSEDADLDTPLRLPRPAAAASSAAAAGSAAASSLPTPPALLYPPGTPLKLVMLVRGDLHMRTGKIAAQTAHAAVGTVLSMQRAATRGDPRGHAAMLNAWLTDGQAKVVLAVRDEPEMLSLERAARTAGLHTHIVADAGRTQVEAGSQTVLAIGPGPIAAIDAITGHLKLL